jgi:hypothetical protein
VLIFFHHRRSIRDTFLAAFVFAIELKVKRKKTDPVGENSGVGVIRGMGGPKTPNFGKLPKSPAKPNPFLPYGQPSPNQLLGQSGIGEPQAIQWNRISSAEQYFRNG